ncbi:hypothetical protein C7M52_02782 [Mixta theicola]|nr:hypothetical protein C7M52_02782 [Mixta theicola]
MLFLPCRTPFQYPILPDSRLYRHPEKYYKSCFGHRDGGPACNTDTRSSSHHWLTPCSQVIPPLPVSRSSPRT